MDKIEQFLGICRKYGNQYDDIMFQCDEKFNTEYGNMIGFISGDNYMYIWQDIYSAFVDEEPSYHLDFELADLPKELSDKMLDMLIYSIENNQMTITKK